jgi:tetratricopeptide (TPR) repeat protein
MTKKLGNISSLICLFVLLCITSNTLSAQSAHKLLRKGDHYYDVQEYSLAENSYRKSYDKDKTSKGAFNLGNSIYNQERYEEAIQHYQSAAVAAKTDTESAGAYYNLGNAYFKNQQLDEAIDAYKQSLRLNPTDKAAKYNLLVSKEVKKQMEQQQQEQQQDQQNQDQENQEQQDQEQQEQQEQQDQGESGEQEEQQEQQESEQDSTQQMEEGGMFDSTRLDKQELDSLDAAKLLQIIESEEKKVQEKLRKFNSNRKKQEKDW